MGLVIYERFFFKSYIMNTEWEEKNNKNSHYPNFAWKKVIEIFSFNMLPSETDFNIKNFSSVYIQSLSRHLVLYTCSKTSAFLNEETL